MENYFSDKNREYIVNYLKINRDISIIREFSCDFVEGGIKSGDTVKYKKSYTCNMYITEESNFCTTEFENTTMKFQIIKVIYSDGTEVNYG